MEDNLVIVESPAKAKTIEKFLGKDFLVKSCFGHIRDLVKKNLGINIEKNYLPQYEVPVEKKKIITDLKKSVGKSKLIWLASDEDREGEAIAWHLSEVLDLPKEKTRRIVFNEITKEAILTAIKNPRDIDINLVNAQQARRVLDRLVGFELSPLLWKKVQPALSAGRVQSVAVRLIVEREREIISFKETSSYKINAVFATLNKNEKNIEFKAEIPETFNTKQEALNLLNKCINAEFIVRDINIKPAKKSPSPPFTTSTLQQEASRKLGFSVSQTMTIAQRLYEDGKITYMRTDSVQLSNLAISTIKNQIFETYGEKYVKPRQYTTKTKGAQEAHEAIRPTYINNSTISGTKPEKRLYELIWKRTVASQMSEALFEKTNITISVSTVPEKFLASGEVMKFDGFLKLYKESPDEENNDKAVLLPVLNVNDKLNNLEITATQKFSHYPPRYTEATLVRKLEELGIGRPSTYAPIIGTIQQRGYIVKEDRPGINRNYTIITLANKKITETIKNEITGIEKAKLFPSDIGMVVNDFLFQHFKGIMDYNFTASVEKDFDEIADGKMQWNKMIDRFYKPFHEKIENTLEKTDKSRGERLLGIDPICGKKVFVKIGRFGPIAQIGETENSEKPKFARLRKGQHLETITLEQALDLFKLPRNLGNFENAPIVVGIGKYGPYLNHNNKFYSLNKDDDPLEIKLDKAIEIIETKREKEKQKIIKTFENNKELLILNGRWGPYISFNNQNYRISKKYKPEMLTFEECLEIINNSKKTSKTKNKKV
ncbi:MAG: type I DNA topoisomerase [Bacteroidia bacterium]|nr:type I DNA topoisomerase [Bacteroidia bacterium]